MVESEFTAFILVLEIQQKITENGVFPGVTARVKNLMNVITSKESPEWGLFFR